MTFWLDDTEDASLLKIMAKDESNNVVTGSVELTAPP
jgi:hypothetical protein